MDYRQMPADFYETLPEELILADHHPANDKYLRDISFCKRQILDATAKVSALHLKIIKLKHKGKKNVEIAEEAGCHPQTVGKALATPNGKRLLSLLQHLAMAIDGPADAQRRHTLWRIAMRNEVDDPRVSISAISEINKMTHAQRQIETGQAGGQRVEIVINPNTLPRGVLDQ